MAQQLLPVDFAVAKVDRNADRLWQAWKLPWRNPGMSSTLIQIVPEAFLHVRSYGSPLDDLSDEILS